MPRICNIPYVTEDKQELNHALLKEVDALPVDLVVLFRRASLIRRLRW